jgi:hypothetical protein
MRREAAICVCAITLAIAAGCSSSASNGAAHDGGTGGGGSVATGDGGDASVASICDRIPLADIQALLPDPLTSVTTTIGDGSQGGIICHVDDDLGGLLIQTYPSDPQKTLFDGLMGGDPTLSGPFTFPISGIGDEAYYFEVTTDAAGTGVSAPALSAHQASGASPSCGIASNDPPDTTMHTTPDGAGGYTATKSDVVAYVQLMGKVCNDVFALSN